MIVTCDFAIFQDAIVPGRIGQKAVFPVFLVHPFLCTIRIFLDLEESALVGLIVVQPNMVSGPMVG